MNKTCDKCGRGFGSARLVLVDGLELCARCAREISVLVDGWVDFNRAGSVSVACPIGDLVGEPHEFAQGSGRLAFLDIMGLAGHVHEVCEPCTVDYS